MEDAFFLKLDRIMSGQVVFFLAAKLVKTCTNTPVWTLNNWPINRPDVAGADLQARCYFLCGGEELDVWGSAINEVYPV